MAYDANDEKQVKEAEKKNALQRAQDLEDLKAILEVPFGVRFMKRLIRKGKIFSTTFTGNSTGFFLEGGRNFMLEIVDDICQVAPTKLVELMIEKPDIKTEKGE